MKRRRAIAAVALVSLPTATPAATATPSITVSVASSMADALRDIGARFRAVRPGVALHFNAAASGVLVQQIVNGAPADLLVCADDESMDRAVRQRVVDAATRRDFAANTLVLVVPSRSRAAPAGMAGLAAPEVRRVAIGKPATVPAGRYARQALEHAGVWAAVAPRLIYADNVRQVLDYVARGEVDAGIVYLTDARLAAGAVHLVGAAPGHAPIVYPVAVVADSRQPALAREFMAFLLGPQAQGLLAERGFARP
jgi:molybdate transport system substrate-binding protein